MPKHEKTNKITAILMVERDRVKALENKLRASIREIEEKAAQEVHKLKIEANKLAKQALDIQECITLEMQTNYNEFQRIEQQYAYKPNGEVE